MRSCFAAQLKAGLPPRCTGARPLGGVLSLSAMYLSAQRSASARADDVLRLVGRDKNGSKSGVLFWPVPGSYLLCAGSASDSLVHLLLVMHHNEFVNMLLDKVRKV